MYDQYSLWEIFNHHLTLKCDKWGPYFDVYEKYFSKYRNKEAVIVEVGVDGGGSLEMWSKYFGTSAKIYGIDNDLKIKELGGATLVPGDQNSILFWDQFLDKVGTIDIFIDDGSHINLHQIKTFNKVWPKINNDGVYLCEDTHTSYWQGFGGELEKPNTFIEYAKQMIDVLHMEHLDNVLNTNPNLKLDHALSELARDIGQISFYNSQVVFIKGKPNFDRIIINNDN
jgi:hypothetical protein